MNKKYLYLLTFLIPFYLACGGSPKNYDIEFRGQCYKFTGIEISGNGKNRMIRTVFGNLDEGEDLYLDDTFSDGWLTGRGKDKDRDGLDFVSIGVGGNSGTPLELTSEEGKYLEEYFIRFLKRSER